MIPGARNRIKGTVSEIKRGTVMCEVKVKVTDDITMASVMTIESLDEMGIKEGDTVTIIAKAVNVLLVKE